MKRIIITVGATLLAAVPVVMGLVGNTSFAQSVPVHVPSRAIVVDDRVSQSKHIEPGDDKGGVTHVEPGDDKGGLTHVEPGDDKGGLTTATQPGKGKTSDSSPPKGDNGKHVGVSGATSGKDEGAGHS